MRSIYDCTYEPLPEDAPMSAAVHAVLPGARLALSAEEVAPGARNLYVVHERRGAVVAVPAVALSERRACDRLVPLIEETLGRGGEPA